VAASGGTNAATVHSRQAKRGEPRASRRKEGRERQGRHLQVGRGHLPPLPKKDDIMLAQVVSPNAKVG